MIKCARCGKSFQCVGCGNLGLKCFCPTCFKRKNGHHAKGCFGEEKPKKPWRIS